MPKENYSLEQQAKCVTHIAKCFSESKDLLKTRHDRLVEIYEAYATFTMKKQSNWASAFKVNKAFQVVNEWLPDIIAKSPRWIVSPKKLDSFEFTKPEEEITPENAQMMEDKRIREESKRASEFSSFIQDYLTYTFEEYSLAERIEDWAKNMLSDGSSWAEVLWKYDVSRVPSKVADEEETLDEEGNVIEVKQITKKQYEEKITGEYPTIDVIDWTEAYFDPRFKEMQDRPYFIRLREGVRVADILRKKTYINKDKVKDFIGIAMQDLGAEDYRNHIFALTGIQNAIKQEGLKDTVSLRYYNGFYNFTDDPEKEAKYRIVTLNDLLVLSVEEVAHIQVEEAKCFPDTKTAFATGVVEPMISLQDEMNYKRNSASEYINKSLNRQVIWSSQSGIDPRKLNDPVVITTRDGATALANIPEIPHREIAASYFQESNDLERQIQAMTFRIDVSQPQSQQSLTDTATGARIKFFESNKVKTMVRKRFEHSMEKLAYKILLAAFENIEENLVIKKMGTEEYWMANKEVLRNAIERYTIKVETNSSSFSDAESRREDAIAFSNVLMNFHKVGVPIEWKNVLEDVAGTFEKRDPNRYLGQAVPQMQPPQGGMPSGMKTTPMTPDSAAALTQQVAGGAGGTLM